MTSDDTHNGLPKEDQQDPVMDIEVTPAVLESFLEAGLINGDMCREVMAEISLPRNWSYWTSQILLTVGAALALCGVIFFFAFNWQDMHRFVKLGVIQVSLIVCCIATVRYGLDSLVGKTFAMASSVLVGVFLAVFGQIYQTGANEYELFLWWAIFIIPWAIATRSAAIWALWITLVNVTIIFLNMLGFMVFLFGSETWIFLLIPIMNLIFLAVIEILYNRGVEWIAPRWMIFMIFSVSLGVLTILVTSFVTEFGMLSRNPAYIMAVIITWVATLTSGYFRYKKMRPDISMLSLGALSICIPLSVFFSRVVLELFHEIGLLFMAAFVLGIFSVAGWWLHETAKEFRRDGHYK